MSTPRRTFIMWLIIVSSVLAAVGLIVQGPVGLVLTFPGLFCLVVAGALTFVELVKGAIRD